MNSEPTNIKTYKNICSDLKHSPSHQVGKEVYEHRKKQNSISERIRSAYKGEPDVSKRSPRENQSFRTLSFQYEGSQDFNEEFCKKICDKLKNDSLYKNAEGIHFENCVRRQSSEEQVVHVKGKKDSNPRKHSVENIERILSELPKEKSRLHFEERNSSQLDKKRNSEKQETNPDEDQSTKAKQNRLKDLNKSQDDKKYGKVDRRRGLEAEDDSRLPKSIDDRDSYGAIEEFNDHSLMDQSELFKEDALKTQFSEGFKDKFYLKEETIDFDELPKNTKEKIIYKYFKDKQDMLSRKDRTDLSKLSWEEAKNYMEIYFGKEKSLNKYSREGKLTHSQHIIRCDRFVPTINKIDEYFHWLHKKDFSRIEDQSASPLVKNSTSARAISDDFFYDLVRSKELLKSNQASKMVDTSDISAKQSIEIQTNLSGIYETFIPSTVDVATEPIDFVNFSREEMIEINYPDDERSDEEMVRNYERYREAKKILKEYQNNKGVRNKTSRSRSRITNGGRQSRHNLKDKHMHYAGDEPKKVKYIHIHDPQLEDHYTDYLDDDDYIMDKIHKNKSHRHEITKKPTKIIKDKNLRFQEVDYFGPESNTKFYESPTYEPSKNYKEKGILKKNHNLFNKYRALEKEDRHSPDELLQLSTIEEMPSSRHNGSSHHDPGSPRKKSTNFREIEPRNHPKNPKEKEILMIMRQSPPSTPPEIKEKVFLKKSAKNLMDHKKGVIMTPPELKQNRLKPVKKMPHSEEQLSSLAEASSDFTSSSSSSRSDLKNYIAKDDDKCYFSDS